MSDKYKTLLWVNRIRKEQGKKRLWRMPKGYMGFPRSCPIALALDGRAYYRIITFDNGTQVPLPLYAQNFMRDFDRGAYPELRIFPFG